MTITLAAVYAPIGLQNGLTGSLFREFAFTLAGAVMISGVVALTLSPMMSSRLLRPGIEDRDPHQVDSRSASEGDIKQAAVEGSEAFEVTGYLAGETAVLNPRLQQL